jgi:hypothetical protein
MTAGGAVGTAAGAQADTSRVASSSTAAMVKALFDMSILLLVDEMCLVGSASCRVANPTTWLQQSCVLVALLSPGGPSALHRRMF